MKAYSNFLQSPYIKIDFNRDLILRLHMIANYLCHIFGKDISLTFQTQISKIIKMKVNAQIINCFVYLFTTKYSHSLFGFR